MKAFSGILIFLVSLILLTVYGCGSSPVTQTLPPIPTMPQTPTITQAPPATSTPIAATATAEPTPTLEAGPKLCSPIEGMPLSVLPEYISSPFEQPTRGQDNGHHGVDFAYYRYADRIGITGVTIQSVMAGKVVANLDDKWPYGFVTIIETRLSEIPAEWLPGLEIPQSIPTIEPGISSLTLPPITATPAWDESSRSLYVLYAHMNEPPLVKPGDMVSCGQALGYVGNTGRSSAPHLHVELRVGPSNLSMTSMAHYDNGASAEEMYNYYVWRVSGLFQVFDTMNLLSQQP